MRETREVVLTPLFRRHAHRPRLTALLNEATAPTILLTAPAGYGKTTLAREWLQGRDDVAWYRATTGSADLGAFSAGLVDALEPIVPGVGDRVRKRLRIAEAPERLARPLAEMLVEDLADWPADGIAVLDDCHLLADSAPVGAFVDHLLTIGPLRVLATARRRPAWATSRRFLQGEIVEFGRDQLAMTAEEAATILEGRPGEAVAELVRQAEGWPAVIGLAAISSDLAVPEERVAESLFRYFAEEVLRREPIEVQEFMLAAAVGPVVGARIARDVLGFGHPLPILERLRSEDLLQETRPDELRFHPLVRDFLRRHLRVTDSLAFADRSRCLITDARAYERWDDAFELALESGDHAEAADVAGRATKALLTSGQSETLEKWLDACGAAAVTVPIAAIARAELFQHKGDLLTAATSARDIVRRLGEDHPDYARACNLAGRALSMIFENADSYASFERASRFARTADDLKSALWGLVVTAIEADPDRTEEHLNRLEMEFPHDIDVLLRLVVGRFIQAERTHSVAGNWDRFAALLPAVEHATDPTIAAVFLASAGQMSRMRGHYAEARDVNGRALTLCTDLRFEFGIATCLMGRSLISIGLRRFTEAARLLEAVERGKAVREDPFTAVSAATVRTRLLASQGRLEEALSASAVAHMVSPPECPLGEVLSTESIILAALGRREEALQAVARARGLRSTVETHLCGLLAVAITHLAREESDRPGDLAREAVRACSRADCLDGVVLACRVHPPLIDALLVDQDTRAIVQVTLSRSRDYELARRHGIAVRPEDTEESFRALTPREREVLTLLCEGRTNAEIARQLFISPSTAKVHVRHILRKLGARNRLEAVLRSQDLLRTDET